jgi:hypothetical protein
MLFLFGLSALTLTPVLLAKSYSSATIAGTAAELPGANVLGVIDLPECGGVPGSVRGRRELEPGGDGVARP